MSNGIKRRREPTVTVPEEISDHGNGLTQAEITEAAGPIVASTLALQRERDAAIAKYNELVEANRQLRIDLAGAVQRAEAAMDMLRLTEERRAVGDAEYRNNLATYTSERIVEQEVHHKQVTALQVELQHSRELLDRIISACLNVVKERAAEAPEASRAEPKL